MLARARAQSVDVNGSPGSTSVDFGGPVRTCLGCRSRDIATDLLRVVFKDGVLTPDPRKQLPGRGAHLHPRQRCFDLAVKRRAFGRALRLDGGPVDTALVLQHLLVVLRERADETTPRGVADKEGSRSDPS